MEQRSTTVPATSRMRLPASSQRPFPRFPWCLGCSGLDCVAMEEQRQTRRRVVVDDSALAGRIGERIREARHQAGLTQQQLAQPRYTKAYISALEKGHAKPSMAALNYLSQRLGLPIGRFLTDANSTWDRLSADLALASADWTNAADAYRSLLDAATDRGAKAEILVALAEALDKQERGDLAIGPATEALEIFTSLGRADDAALAVYWLSNAHLQADNRAEARALLLNLLATLRERPGANIDLRIRVLVALGLVEGDEREHRRAIAYFEEAATLSGDLDDRRRAVLLHGLAVAYYEGNDIEAAVRAGRESLSLYRSASAHHEAAVVQNQLALAYLANGNVTRAGQLAGQARLRHELDGDQRALAHVAETQAQIAIAEGRYDDAITLAYEARAMAEATSSVATHSMAMLTIARAQAAAGDTDAACQSYATGVEELRARGPASRLRQGLADWAELLATLGRHEEAYALSREALEADRMPAVARGGTITKARGAHQAESEAAGSVGSGESLPPAAKVRVRANVKTT